MSIHWKSIWVCLARAGDWEGLYLAFGKEIYPPSLFDQYRETLIAPAGTVTDKNLKRFIILAEKTKGFNVEPQIDKIQSPILALGVF